MALVAGRSWRVGIAGWQTWQRARREHSRASLHRACAADGIRMVSLGPDTLRRGHGQWSPSDRDGLDRWSRPGSLDARLRCSDQRSGFWVVPDGVIYAGRQSFWFGTPTVAPSDRRRPAGNGVRVFGAVVERGPSGPPGRSRCALPRVLRRTLGRSTAGINRPCRSRRRDDYLDARMGGSRIPICVIDARVACPRVGRSTRSMPRVCILAANGGPGPRGGASEAQSCAPPRGRPPYSKAPTSRGERKAPRMKAVVVYESSVG